VSVFSSLATLVAGCLIAWLTARLWTGRPPRWSGIAVGAVALTGGLVALRGSPAPTGNGAEDALLRALAVVVLASISTIARPWAWLFAATVALMATGGGANAMASAAVLGLALGSIIGRARPPVLGAAIGAAVGLVTMDLRWPGAQRASTLVGLLIATVLIGSGLRSMVPRWRRWTAGVVGLASVMALVAALGFGVAALRAKTTAAVAIENATDGLSAARRTDSVQAAAKFHLATEGFRRAHRAVTAWWARPACLVPGLAQQARVATVLTGTGARLAAAAADTSNAADPEVFRVHAGTLDLARMTALRPSVDRSLRVTEQASGQLRAVRSPWVLPTVDRELVRLQGRIRSAVDQARTLDDVVRVAPALLGADGPRHYFLAVQNEAELRGGGGLIGNYGELTADGGRVRLTRFGRIQDLNPPELVARRHLSGPADYVARYGRFGVEHYFQDASFSPDFPSTAQVIEQLYPQSGGQAVDGVISVDPFALAAILRLTGPVSVAGWPVPITADNAPQILLHDQYLALGQSTRTDFLSTTTRAVFDRLISGALPGPTAVLDDLGPAVRAKHIMIHALRAGEEELVARMGATGAVPSVNGDFIAVVGQNASQSKIDWYIRRHVSYDATVDPGAGTVRATADVALANLAPDHGEPPYILGGGGDSLVKAGDNRMYLSIYSPLALTGATLDGRHQPMESQVEQARFVYSVFVTVPAGGHADLRIELAGSVLPGSTYRLDVSSQPTVVPDDLAVAVHPAPGWRLANPTGTVAGRTSLLGPLNGNVSLVAHFSAD